MTIQKKIGYVMAYREGHNNYGTSLQGYALLNILQHLGYEVRIINYIRRLNLLQKVRFIINAILAGNLNLLYGRAFSKRKMARHPSYMQGIVQRTQMVDKYKKEKLIPSFQTFDGYKSLHEGTKDFDAVVVGSDQVWSPMSLPNGFFNLMFVPDGVPKLAYASSFGVSEIPSFQRKATARYLNRFDVISVRELRAKEIVEDLSDKEAQVVSDPTLLLSREEWWKEIADVSIGVSKPYIFCYFLGTNREAREAANKLSCQTGLSIVTIPNMEEYIAEDEDFGDMRPYDVGPNEFVKYISQAEYVCTDSFHCTVFSILFHRHFMTFYRFAHTDRSSRNSRINSLFKFLDIDDSHLYKGNIMDINNELDYDAIDKRVAEIRDDSIAFLSSSLSKCIQKG